ncbi:MAG: hypothetical protein QM820_07135 [Minicystis sp.]
MAEDFVPQGDDEFHHLQDQFVGAVSKDPDKYGVTAADATALQDAQAAWQQAYPEHKKAQAEAQTKTQKKDAARKQLEERIRGAARKISGTSSVTNELRVAAGLSPRTATRSAKGAPTTRPVGRIDVQPHRTLVIHFADEETPTRAAKPADVHGCEIWSFIGDAPPADPSQYSFLGLDTRTPYTDVHDAEDAGKTAHYLLRWQNRKGEPGPWGHVISIKIPSLNRKGSVRAAASAARWRG